MEFLYLRWLSGTTDPQLLRGIETVRKTTNGTKRTTYRLDVSYRDRQSCNHVGLGVLQNGQWWPLQIAAMGDDAHGGIEAGIHGKPERLLRQGLDGSSSEGSVLELDEGGSCSKGVTALQRAAP